MNAVGHVQKIARLGGDDAVLGGEGYVAFEHQAKAGQLFSQRRRVINILMLQRKTHRFSIKDLKLCGFEIGVANDVRHAKSPPVLQDCFVFAYYTIFSDGCKVAKIKP